MISRKILDEILQDPLGPYHDKDVLDETCKSTGRCQLVLYSFVLEHNGKVIGYVPFGTTPNSVLSRVTHTASMSPNLRLMDQGKIIASFVSVVSSTSLIQSGSLNSVSRWSRQSLTCD